MLGVDHFVTKALTVRKQVVKTRLNKTLDLLSNVPTGDLYFASRYADHKTQVIVKCSIAKYLGYEDITYSDIENYFKWWAPYDADETSGCSTEGTVDITCVRLMAENVVVVVKCNDKPRMNGEVGFVVRYSVKTAKYKVKLECRGGSVTLIKMKHLMIVF